MSTATTEYRMPVLHACDRVEFSKDTTWQHPVVGFIYQDRQRSADIAILRPGSVLIYHDCLYYDDPRVTERPELLDEKDRGVFRLAQSELNQRAVEQELVAQRELLEKLAVQIATVQKTDKKFRNDD